MLGIGDGSSADAGEPGAAGRRPAPACSSRSLLGYVTTKKAGTPFAMITLGIGELVRAMVADVPEFFGGEGGVTANRTVGKPFLGITFGPQIQVYYLIAIYTLHLHRGDVRLHAHAARPDAERGARQPRAGRVHRLQHAARALPRRSSSPASSPASPAACAALNFEIATAEVVGAGRSGAYLLFTFLGGATFFFGPIIGARADGRSASRCSPSSPRPGSSTSA